MTKRRKTQPKTVGAPLVPARRYKDLIALLDSLEPLGPEDEFPEIDDPPPEPVDL